MPLYQWDCPNHGEFEAQYKMDSKPSEAPCPVCNAGSRQVVRIGGVQGDELPPWCKEKDFMGCLQNCAERPLETRTEYNRYIKDHGIIEDSKNRMI